MTTLYLTERGSLVKKDGDTLVIHVPGDEKRGVVKRKVRLPLLKVTQVVVMTESTLTSPALNALLDQGTEVCFLTPYGRFRGRMAPAEGKNSLLRLAQFRAHEDPVQSLVLARVFVRGKLSNMRTMLLRANRKRKDDDIKAAAESLRNIIKQVDAIDCAAAAPPPDPQRPQAETAKGSLLGLEGAGAAAYFGVFGRLLKGDWQFEKRTRRPPKDPVNALLSYGYVLLMNVVASACQVVGFDPYVCFLHSSQYGKPALALDVMEEFRTPVVDSVVTTLLNNEMLKVKDIEETLGAYRLTDDGRRTFLTQFEMRLNAEITHPTFKYKANYRRCIELQARLVAKRLMGEIPAYRPFVVR